MLKDRKVQFYLGKTSCVGTCFHFGQRLAWITLERISGKFVPQKTVCVSKKYLNLK